MKALVCDRYGSLDAMSYRAIEEPVAEAGDIEIRVRRAGVCHTDLLFALGRYQATPPLPFIPGSEVAGEVITAPPGSRFRPGDRVTTLAPRFGGFAERVTVPEWAAQHLPANASDDAGAALMSSFGTAQHALRQRAGLSAGETLLVTGAAGGTGIAAVQIGALLGARVIAACSSDEKAEFCRRNGAHETINYSREDLKSRLRELTQGRGADVVYETVGGTVFNTCTRSTAVCGRLLVVGFASGQLPTFPVNLALVKMYALVGVHWLTFLQRERDAHRANMAELVGWLERGEIDPPIHRVAPLSDGVALLRQLAGRQVLGKLVLAPGM